MIRADIREAIESARTSGRDRPRSCWVLRAKLLEVVRNLPEDMSIRELREDLEE